MSGALARAREYLANGQFEHARATLDAYLKGRPKDADGLLLRAFAASSLGQAVEAAGWLRKATNAGANRWEVHFDAGIAYLGLNRPEEALLRFQTAERMEPEIEQIPRQIGRIYLDMLKLPSLAAAAFRRAIAIDANDLESQYHLGKALFDLGDIDAAMDLMRECRRVAMSEDRGDIAALCLQAIATAIPGAMSADNAEILRARRDWTETLNLPHGAAASFSERDRNADRPLTIGYISSFFDSENWMKPVWGLINQQDREQYPVRIFSFGPVPGCEEHAPAATAYRPHETDRVFDVDGLEHERIAALIAEEGVDVLVDLNGYSDPQGLQLMAMKPAPVLAGWFNMYATTALGCFDYLIGDRHVVLPEEEEHYSERIARVPGSYLTFDVGYPVPEVVSGPAARNGFITFGSLCSRYKLTPEVIRAWSEILQRCPAARLVLRNGGLEKAAEREYLLQQFASHAVEPGRLELLGRAPHFEFLETYGQIDIALDTFPYNGGTTTTEAIWQGVPVVTYAGRTWASRTSATLLREGKLGDWVADDLAGYVELAVRWGNDPDAPQRFAELRTAMRVKLSATSVCDTAGFARAMETLYRGFWREWCRR